MKKLILISCLVSPSRRCVRAARVSPAVGLAKHFELYTLAVPTEKENAATTQIEFSPPSGFSIDSFVPSPGWNSRLSRPVPERMP